MSWFKSPFNFQKLVKPVLLKALENCARQPSQVAIVTEAVHAAAILIKVASAEEAGTAGRAEKTAELAKLLNVESAADKQVWMAWVWCGWSRANGPRYSNTPR